MKNNAISVANAFIDIAQKSNDNTLTPLKLMKLVYIAHGLCLAVLDKSMLDPRFDWVEAWKLGPVIPSVYHTFKHYINQPITKKGVILKDENENGIAEFDEPILKGTDENKIVSKTWDLFGHFNGSELVQILHQKGTPWQLFYKKGLNEIIPDEETKKYYTLFIDIATSNTNE